MWWGVGGGLQSVCVCLHIMPGGGGGGALLFCNTWLICGCCLAQKGEAQAEAKAPEPQVEVEEEEEEEIVESDIGKRTPRVSV